MEKQKTKVTADQLKSLTEQFVEIHRKMDFIETLSPEQRGRIRRRMSPRNLELLQNQVETARQNRESIPSTFDLAALEENAVLTPALAALVEVVDKIQADVEDTFLTVGNLAVVGAASAITYLKVESTTARRLKPIERSRRSRSASGPPAEVSVPGQSTGTETTPGAPSEPNKQAA